MARTVMRFTAICESFSLIPPHAPALNHLNSAPWMGRPARSCRMTDIRSVTPSVLQPGGKVHNMEFAIEVEYRSPDEIVGVVGDPAGWWEGWRHARYDGYPDGRLLDGHGKELPPGTDPVILRWDVIKDVDFNDFDFGDLTSEVPWEE